ncbi:MULTISPECIES: co-chaperone DjlA [Rhodanobacter]|uniref:Protein with DnaJ-like domain n=1 Tax=Rhodanobacter denitrificans TaxID=666685 RepID=I4WW54_9GAMM|nr:MULTISPECIES: co-chaperone DjlA [Rhodanobacter]AGG90500.1 protein with DnaJ-like domain [Rhodanobacter denitrificans]EIM03696.1 protein with DnaJ-like domain [Rhodanobacter denitrificans]KZC21113.1 molecular chaperone DjlA [Rhodanobacter denitrificans]UJJ50591.1 co-chaperone DjlA [Rhodanobacter denitrificans]UJJ57226.1 co-chaperone DjlA [Rhodanobacter denitrificans]
MSYTYTLWFAFFGLLVGHLPGAITGAVIGFIFDNMRYSQRKHATPEAGGFVGPLFTLLGAVAKSDGRVSEQEIAIAERLMTRMGLDAEQRRQAVASFNAGKQPEFDVTQTIAALRNWVGLRRDHAFPVLDVVIETVLAEGNPPPEKMSILRQLAFALRISDMELMALMAMKGYAWNAGPGGSRGHAYGTGGGYVPPQRAPQGPDPYAVLGIDRNADERAIKRAYRKLISEHHPDRLGDLPEDMRKRAESRASEINAAYDRIKEARGFK